MLTSSYFTFKGPGRIGISRGFPRGYTKIPMFRQLAPGPWFNSVSKPEYEKLFYAQLAALNPQAVWDELHRLAGDAEPVLLCYERTPFTDTNWCHRRMVASWLESTLGIVVNEYEPKSKALQGGLF